MTDEEHIALERSNRLACKLMDQDWLAQCVSQEELDQSRLETQQIYAELDKGKSLDAILQQLDKPRRKRKVKPPMSVPS